MVMTFQIITLFPERYESYFQSGLPGRAAERELFRITPISLREFAEPGRKGKVDDAPYGGGPGMVLQVGPVDRALQSMPEKHPVILFTPRGSLLDQPLVRQFSKMSGFTLIAGYYEGVDERVANHLVDHQLSIGNFVVSSGDLPILCFIEAVIRLLPGYMGSPESPVVESHEDGRLEYPQYTRPAVYRGWETPKILLSGDHNKIEAWRRKKSLEITEVRMGKNGNSR